MEACSASGFELDRGGGGEDERLRIFVACHIELPVGNAEGVAGENAVAGGIVDAEVVAGVAGGVDEGQHAAVEVDPVAIIRCDDALGRRRQDVAIEPMEQRFAIDGDGAGDQFGRVDQVARALGMHHQARIRTSRQQGARGAGMIEVDMGGDHIVDRLGAYAQLCQAGEQVRDGMLGAGIDQGGMAALDDEVNGSQAGTQIAGIDGVDAVFVVSGREHGELPGVGNVARAVLRPSPPFIVSK